MLMMRYPARIQSGWVANIFCYRFYYLQIFSKTITVAFQGHLFTECIYIRYIVLSRKKNVFP